MNLPRKLRPVLCLFALLAATCSVAGGQSDRDTASPVHAPATPATLEELKAAGALRSSYRRQQRPVVSTESPQPQLATFRRDVLPLLKSACVQCHGPETQGGNIRIDTLDPDLLHGDDVNWWLEIMAVLSNGEMPPPDEVTLADDDRGKIIQWLSTELQVASTVRRAQQGHSSFRRMTRYELNYALQDLLGLPYDFAKDLPPEASSVDGFQNSSEVLHMSVVQFQVYRELARQALRKATVRGEQPAPIYWGASMQAASAAAWEAQDAALAKIRKQHKDDPEALQRELARQLAKFQGRPGHTHYKKLETGQVAPVTWRYPGAKYAWKPSPTPVEVPAEITHVAVIPPGQKLIVELGDTIPERGTLRVRVRASRAKSGEDRIPSLQLEFGWQASNDSQASVRVSRRDLAIVAAPGQPEFYQWDIPLSEVYPRNSVRGISKMGDLPSPSEYLKLVNSSVSHGDIQLDFVEVTAPVYDQWPPASHVRLLGESPQPAEETARARDILTGFMTRAWRRTVTPSEVDQKVALFTTIRRACDDFQEAIVEVLATVLASPKFLYLVLADQPQQGAAPGGSARLSDVELATRLAMFLWCSVPDQPLLDLAASGRLNDRQGLQGQAQRMLADPRSGRFSRQFVRQWLNLQLLEFLKVDRKVYPQFNPALKEALLEEPIAFFQEVLRNNHSVLDFVHADYTLVNERLAGHYGLPEVHGNHFRRVSLAPEHRRGGLLTQAGLLAMNSDGKDSHPLKRGIWLLEKLLDDPPPPPPPAVPEIDLADPDIAKLTLKQRIENHRNQAACLSCHAKIDPWGIAFENFDAIGSWRTQVQGQPVDASSRLFNGQKLEGIDGLKRFLLENRQDQFVRAMVHKMATYALGRPLTFGDRSRIDQLAADLRKNGDGLATLVTLIVTSELFQTR